MQDVIEDSLCFLLCPFMQTYLYFLNSWLVHLLFIKYLDTASGLGNSLTSLGGGRCKEGHMKMKVYVCKENNDPKCREGNKGVLFLKTTYFCSFYGNLN